MDGWERGKTRKFMTQMYQNNSSLPRRIIYSDVPVVTTELLADSLGVSAKAISNNFKNNAKRYQEGVHYFLLTGKDLRQFKHSENLGMVRGRSSKLYLWTERGCYAIIEDIASDSNYDTYKSIIADYFRVRKVTHNFLPNSAYKKSDEGLSSSISTKRLALQQVVVNGEIHGIGGTFNINNALRCYNHIKCLGAIHVDNDLYLQRDLEMLEVLNPDYSQTIDFLRFLYSLYASIFSGGSNKVSFYEIQNN